AAAGGLRRGGRRAALPERQREDVQRSRARDGGGARLRAAKGSAVTSYRFRRRAFIAAMSGGVGLKIMLRNLEGSAQGVPWPARLLVTHWPLGIVCGSSDALWKPTAGSVGGSPGLKPFADAGLGPDMTVIRGLSTTHLNANGGGGHEAGTVLLMTGRDAGGTR